MKVSLNHFGRSPILVVAAPDDDWTLDSEADIAPSNAILETDSGMKQKAAEFTTTVKGMIESISNELFKAAEGTSLSEMQLEFSLAFSEKFSLWAIGVSGNQGIKINLKWNRKD